MSVLMAATAAILFAVGTYLLMQRQLSRLIVGLGLIGHGDPEDFADPLPQTLVLTAIVISFGVTALLLALAYRSWMLTADDEVEDDIDDRAVGRDS